MKPKNYLLTALVAMTACGTYAQTTVAHFDMSLNNGSIVEQQSNRSYTISSQLPACTINGIDGQALRFDGYSNYVRAGLPVSSLSTDALTMQVVLAAESYPMMQMDVAETTPTYATICGNLDESAKKGFAIQLSSQGDLRLVVAVAYGNGYLVTVDGNEKLPRGSWQQLTAVFDKAGNAATLYLNGIAIGSKRVNRCALVHSDKDFMIGKEAADKKAGLFLVNTFCGAIDDIRISNEVTDFTLVDPMDFSFFPRPDFNYPADRYASVPSSGNEASLWRPQFHGMPSGSWTNETHGLIYSGGKYHVFFQKNPNGPYMSRLHWGHISSTDLCEWKEEPIAIYPGEAYDIKGCWSGCVYEDAGDTYILYTAVDNAKARIAQARAKDASLTEWEKLGVVIDGRPSGLSDDFRDPYFFQADGNKYVIVGTSKNGIGACTLHKYQNGAWTNDGTIFFQGNNTSQHGTFWEMPNMTLLTPAEGGKPAKWLFTCTPLNTGPGVRTLYWVGTINTDGKFIPDGDMQYLEMAGISRDGYGLLSPSILPSPHSPLTSPHSPLTSHLLIGIVPDKLPTETNFEMGWAHNYSLPREISLDANGKLVQKPYSGLTAMRTKTAAHVEESLLGSKPLVGGRQLELLGEFTPTTGTCGFRFLKNASLTYDADTKKLTLDLTALNRQANDNGVYNGIYATTLTEPLSQLHVFLDGSILDIFVNERWAYSVRLFPTDATQTEAEVFATAATTVKVSAWTLDASQTSGVAATTIQEQANDTCYDLCGRRVDQPGKGVYIRNGKKYVRR